MADIYFYLHPCYWPQGEIPQNADDDWPGFGLGIYAWTIQTYLRLKSAGISCQLVSQVPTKGILIAHRECLSSMEKVYAGNVLPNEKLFIVDIAADESLYPYANLHIVQNPWQEKFFENCYYMPHWPQPGLIPRDIQRGGVFENIVYYGDKKSIPSELLTDEWIGRLKEIGLKWRTSFQGFYYDKRDTYLAKNSWSNFSDVDAVVAIRDFAIRPHPGYRHKPASKLFNAWIAGVPAILGRESAYCFYRKNEFDYLEANSASSAFLDLKRLKEDPTFREAMVANGLARKNEISPSATILKWKELLVNIIIPSYNNWLKKNAIEQHWSIQTKRFSITASRVKTKWWDLFSKLKNAKVV